MIKTVAEPHINEEDVLNCECGNDGGGLKDGFEPCTMEGNIVEPTYSDWPEPLYLCLDCGKIIDYERLIVVGHA